VRRETAAADALELLTPEQVAIRLRVGDLGSRFGALVADLLVQGLVLVVLSVALLVLGPLALADGGVAAGLLLVAAFVVRVLYFPWFELRWKGRTPGKRLTGLRVVAWDGGPLDARMVFARNLTREVEIFLPLSAMLAPESLVPGAGPLVRVATLVWVLTLVAVPLVNRWHLRLGDLFAGTVVVAEPQPVLHEDLAVVASSMRADAEFAFTSEQLDHYGIHELQVLEELLRRPPSDVRERTIQRVAETVAARIGWGEPLRGPARPERFLHAFYAAQRRRLETRLLLGERRERKAEGGGG